MSGEKQNVTVHGIGFFGLLTIVLIVLKLTGAAEIGWAIILTCFFAPLFFMLALLIVAIVASIFFAVGSALSEAYSNRRAKK